MSYLVFCTFDLKKVSSKDYQNAYDDLAKLGLKKVHKGTVIPTTSVMGEFNGESAAAVRDEMLKRVRSAFSVRNFESEIFLTVGGDWAWGSSVT